MICLPILALCATQTPSSEMLIRSAFVYPVLPNRRSVVHIDPIESSLLTPLLALPETGWKPIEAKSDGWFESDALSSAYVRTKFVLLEGKTMLLEAQGDSLVYVNGELRVGDPYQYGYVSLPVSLQKGLNTMLFLCSRGRLKVRLVDPPCPISLDLRDSTTPDVRPSDKLLMWAAVVVRNSTTHPLKNLTLTAGAVNTSLGDVPAMSIRKVGFRFKPSESLPLSLTLRDHGHAVDKGNLTLAQRKSNEPYKRTFVSELDGSVQYYAVNPATQPGFGKAFFLSLHGASVEAIGQSQAYSAKSWGNIVCPTNRRPYGFDWEDMGRRDAMEVLALAKRELNPDPTRIYLCGHSMGGHGTWQLGAHFPDQFAAIGPSAGWVSFLSYGGGKSYSGGTEIEGILNRAGSSSDTLGIKQNYASEGIYILHGDADDNVPVSEAREMRKALEPFHRDLSWYEQPGAGHWWDVSPEPGADCVDWPPLFNFFSRHRLSPSSEVLDIDFTTENPGVSATCNWVTVQSQIHCGEFSRVQLHAQPFLRTFVGTTSNISRLEVSLTSLHQGADVTFQLDGQKVGPMAWPHSGVVSLEVIGDRWTVATKPVSERKNPDRYGGFKDIFRNRMMFVVGTQGSEEENSWATQKARYDAETLWYRGNGSVDIVKDTDFIATKFADRNVLLYGNADTNKAWNLLLSHCPIQVHRHQIRLNGHDAANNDSLATVFIYPRPDSQTASVAVIAGTGPVGNKIANRVPIFLSGAGFPDALEFNEKSITDGLPGVLLAGYFGQDWGWNSGDWAISGSLR